MTEPNLTLVVVAAVLVAAGVYLLLERSLTRILIGVLLASNGVNVLFLVAAGPAGGAPIIGVTAQDAMSDPLPQAMVLTAIVITLGVTAYLLTLAYRSFQINGHDEVADDVEDRAIRRLAEADLASDSYDAADDGHPDELGQGTGDEEGERVATSDRDRTGSDGSGSDGSGADGSGSDGSGSDGSGSGEHDADHPGSAEATPTDTSPDAPPQAVDVESAAAGGER